MYTRRNVPGNAHMDRYTFAMNDMMSLMALINEFMSGKSKID